MVSDALTRFVAREVGELAARFPRALDDNRAAEEVLTLALERAAMLGLEVEGPVEERPIDISSEELWHAWWSERNATVEARSWPERLGVGSVAERQAAAEAASCLVDAGTELGMTGAVGGRRARRTPGTAAGPRC